jgi:uncharacterized protein (DUF2252 family)
LADITKDSAWGGLEDYVPDELKAFAAELSRRMERFANSQFYQLRAQATLYTNDLADPPAGMKPGDVWVATTGVYRYSGTAWEAV